MRPLRLLHVVLGFPPAVAFGGTATAAYNLSVGLARRGHHVHVLTTNRLNKRQKMFQVTCTRKVEPDITVTFLDTFCIPLWPGFMGPAFSPDLSQWLIDNLVSFDLIHIHGYRDHLAHHVARVAYHNDIPFVIQPHGSLPIVLRSKWLKQLYDRLMGRQTLLSAKMVIALTSTEVAQCRQKGIPGNKIRIIPNGYDDFRDRVEQGHFRQRYSIPLYRPVVLFVGSLNRNKGVDILVRAFAQVSDALDEALLVIVGPDDGELKTVRRLITKYSLHEKVIIVGALGKPDVFHAIRDADLFVLPGPKDTFPMSLIEACMMGVPVVVSESCEIAHLVHDYAGLSVKAHPDDVALAILTLLTYHELRKEHGLNARKLFEEQFSLHRVVDELEALYKSVLRSREEGMVEYTS